MGVVGGREGHFSYFKVLKFLLGALRGAPPPPPKKRRKEKCINCFY